MPTKPDEEIQEILQLNKKPIRPITGLVNLTLWAEKTPSGNVLVEIERDRARRPFLQSHQKWYREESPKHKQGHKPFHTHRWTGHYIKSTVTVLDPPNPASFIFLPTKVLLDCFTFVTQGMTSYQKNMEVRCNTLRRYNQ